MTEKQQDNEKQENNVEENQNPNLENQILTLEQDNKILNDKILRLAAELDNTRRRGKEDLEKANKYAISNFANDLVLIVENFYLAADNLPQEEIVKSLAIKNFIDAMLMTKKELTKTLEKYNIKRIYPLGEKFDHNYHEAISRISIEENEEEGVVKQVIQAGYSIGDRLMKPALVTVSTAK